MSPVRRVLVLTLILGVLGISVSLVIVAVGGGFGGPTPSVLNPPSSKDLWIVGEGISNDTRFDYTLTANNPPLSLIDSVISMRFIDGGSDTWKLGFGIKNGTNNYIGNVFLSKEYLTNRRTPEGDLKNVYRILESSLLDIRNFATEPKYLVPGAVWDDVVSGALTVPIRVTGQDSILVNGTATDSYILEYDLPTSASKIWVAHGFPLPLKADVRDSEGRPKYAFEIQGYRR